MGLTQITTGGVDDNINIDNNTLKVDGTNNRVGIGTASPIAPLHVNAGSTNDALFIDSSDAVVSMGLAASDGAVRLLQISGGLAFRTGGNANSFGTGDSEKMRIDSSGNVGIGTTSADFKLDVNGSIGVTEGQVVAWHDGSGNLAARVYGSSTDELRFEVGSGASRAMTIDSSGRLLVGTSSARTNYNNTNVYGPILNLEGTSNSNRVLSFIHNDNSGGPFITLGSTGGSSAGSNNLVAAQSTLGFLSFQGADGTDLVEAAQIKAQVDGTPGSNDMPGRLVFSTTADGASSPTERMRIDSNGVLISSHASINGGIIGTNGNELRLQSDINANGTPFTSFYVGSGEKARIDSSGRLLLGTTTEGAAGADNLTVADSGTCGITIRSGTSSNGNIYFSDATSGSGEYAGYIQYRQGDNALCFGDSSAERLRIDSSGRVLIGVGSGDGKLVIRQDQNTTSTGTFTNPHVKLTALSTTNNTGFTGISYAVSTLDTYGWTVGAQRVTTSGTDGAFVFRHHNNSATGNERLRLFHDGRIAFDGRGVTSSSSTEDVFYYKEGHVYLANGGDAVLFLNRNTNDGTILQFRQANSTEGGVSVSGSTVSYNGAHLSRWSQLAGGAERTEILRGSVLSNLDEMCEWGEEDNEQLNRMKVSDVEGDPNVAGVFQAWDDDDDTYTNDFYCAMTGDFVIRIAQGTTIARGDLLMSAGDGTAKPQDDDIVRSKTIAKVTSTTVSTTYSDGSYCVPCVLMAC